MPNTSVRAAAEGLPNVSRRKALALLTGGLAAAVTAPAHTIQPVPVTTVQDVLSACHAAEEAYGLCEAREAAIAKTLGDKLFPEWTTPSGINSKWSHIPKVFRTSKALEAELAQKREQVEKSVESGLMTRSAFVRWMGDIEAQGAEGLASLREQEGVIAAAGYHDAYEQTDEAFTQAKAAFEAVMALRCQTIEEVRAKAACIIRVYRHLGVEIDGDDLVACMSSLCEEV
ncbi:MAG: hypothetical protein E5V48_02515 [Mesorhizobium sp.]|nr:MAG: hypothetical protein E5V48_02515 [Mesorhizobium sp.]